MEQSNRRAIWMRSGQALEILRPIARGKGAARRLLAAKAESGEFVAQADRATIYHEGGAVQCRQNYIVPSAFWHALEWAQAHDWGNGNFLITPMAQDNVELHGVRFAAETVLDFAAREAEEARALEHLSGATSRAAGEAGPSRGATTIDEPDVSWCPLWQGPFRYRATYDRGRYGEGHTLDQMARYGDNPSVEPISEVRADPEDGAIVIQWLVGCPGRRPPFQSERFHQGPEHGYYARLRDDPVARAMTFQHLPRNLHDRAVGSIAVAVTIRHWLTTEFYHAVDSGRCVIWARMGSRLARFTRVPADVFRAYQVKSWGYGKAGGAIGELEGEPTLYAVHVAPPIHAEPQTITDVRPIPPLPSTRSERGRPKGSGSFALNDALLYGRMRQLIDSREAQSVFRAAQIVAPDAAGSGTLDSKARRLQRGYQAWRKNVE